MKVYTEDKNFNATNAQSTKQQKQTDKKEQQKVNAKYKWSETVVLGSKNFGLTAKLILVLRHFNLTSY